MQAEGVATSIFGRSCLLVLLNEPNHTSVLVNHILRQEGSLLTRDNQLRFIGVEDEDVEIVVQQVIVQILAHRSYKASNMRMYF